MSKQATKALGNRYCQARLNAAKYNEAFANRATAAEQLPGVTEDSLKKYELDINRPPNTVVALMADAYNEPELRAWYCANECPLGKDCREIEEMPPVRALLRLQNSMYQMEQPIRKLSLILEDGGTDREKAAIIPEIRNELLECKRRLEENLAQLERAERLGRF